MNSVNAMIYIFLFIFALFVSACSESVEMQTEPNPYLPISGLQIPKHASQGDTLFMQGDGFEESCAIALQLNGVVDTLLCDVIAVEPDGISVELPSGCKSGFYAIILSQSGVTYRIGGVNITGGSYEEKDFELYVLGGATMEIYAASVSKQLIDSEPLHESGMKDLDFSGYAVALPNGDVYYTSYGMYVVDGWIKEIHNLGVYNMVTHQRTIPVAVENLFAIGSINNEFYLVKTDSEYKNYTLVKWSSTSEQIVAEFDFSAFGGARILSIDQKFHYYAKENVILFSGNMGKGDSMGQAAFAIDLESGEVFQVGNNPNYRYAFAPAGEKLYCFATLLDEGDIVKSVALEIQDVRNWSILGSGVLIHDELNGMAFDMPEFSPITNMIYGVNDSESFSALITFNIQTGCFESKRWISPGIGGYFYSAINE